MLTYLNLSGDSGVVAFALGRRFIDVEFRQGARYRYSARSCGKTMVDEMSRLAIAGRGLSTFIAQHNPEFERRLDA